MSEKKSFRTFGIFGYPLSHTRSPAMQEAAFEKAGIKAFYLVFELAPKEFRQALKGIRYFLLDGFNVTVPYKQTVMKYLDRLTPEAKAAGAVNTVFRQKEKWIGTNTDVHGFLFSLQREGRFKIKGKRALILGAGGAARAVLYGLASKGIAQMTVANRHPHRAAKLCRDFQRIFPRVRFKNTTLTRKKELAAALQEADLIVNATSVGLKTSDSNIIPEKLIPKAGRKKLFFDLIYHRSETAFLRSAKKKGHRILGGMGMLLHQGAKAFECWTGKKAPLSLMQKILWGVIARSEATKQSPKLLPASRRAGDYVRNDGHKY